MGGIFSNNIKLNYNPNWQQKKTIIQKAIQKNILDIKDLYSLFGSQNKSQQQYQNLYNLEQIKLKYGPQIFYGNFVLEVCQFALDFENDINQGQQIQFQDNSLQLTRRQCCQLICLMMFSAFQQTTSNTNKLVNFNTLFEQSSQNRNESNFGKLECIFNYIMSMSELKKDKNFMDEIIIIKRQCLQDSLQLVGKMTLVEINTTNPIQYYSNCAQVDFANKNIGGGVLRNGSLQEEISFATCPEMIVSLLFAETLKDDESLIFQNIQKYTNHTGYASSFQFTRQVLQLQQPLEIVAIDSINYSKQSPDYQFKPQIIEREFKKAYTGFSGVNNSTIATGNWGCGDFKSDPQLKFLIQWLACSLSQKNMIYCTFREKKLNYVQQIIDLLQNKSIEYVMNQVKMLKKNQYSVFEQILYNSNKNNQFNKQYEQYPSQKAINQIQQQQKNKHYFKQSNKPENFEQQHQQQKHVLNEKQQQKQLNHQQQDFKAPTIYQNDYGFQQNQKPKVCYINDQQYYQLDSDMVYQKNGSSLQQIPGKYYYKKQ